MKYFIYLITLCFFSITLHADNNAKVIEIKNEFIKIIVNKGPLDLGRFSIETTKGDPKNITDDNELLIYGRPIPWTSYTTIKINNKNYIFGGKSKKTERRVGIKANYGNVIMQKKYDNEIITITEFGKIQVTQRLSFLRNPITKVKDTAIINYSILNNDTITHNIGIRIMLDTKLGTNDGTPFRIGEKTITSELRLEKKELADYWLTFDNLITPNVIAQGTLYSKKHKISWPDYLIISNWGTLVDFPWSFKYQQGRSFIRTGETEKDTALALYWNPIKVAPNTKRTVNTLYGLGELSISPGDMSLGITAPKEVPVNESDSFLVMGYLSNSGGFDMYNIDISFKIPKNLKIVNGSLNYTFKQLKSGKTVQIPLRLRTKENAKPGVYSIQLSSQSTTLESNKIHRKIKLLAPPLLDYNLSINPVESLKSTGNNHYYDINLRLKNNSKHTIKNIKTKLKTTKDMQLLPIESKQKTISKVYSKSHYDLNWRVKANSNLNQKILFHIAVNQLKEKIITGSLTTEISPVEWKLEKSKQAIFNNDYFFVKAKTVPNNALNKEQVVIVYNKKKLKYLKLSIHPDIKSKIKVKQKPGKIIVSNITAKPTFKWDHILKFYFKTKKEGETEIELISIPNTATKTILINKKEKENDNKK